MTINITDAIFGRAALFPDTLAIIDERRSLDYRALCLAVRRAANQFAQAGWKAGDIIGISMSRDPTQYLVCALALARMGAVQVSVSPADSIDLRTERARRLRVSAMVTDRRRVAVKLKLPTLSPDPDWFGAEPIHTCPVDIRADGSEAPWIINETSGTTATPKAIGISHAAANAHRKRHASLFGHLPSERFLNLTGMQFLTALKRAINCLSDGGTLTLPPANLATDQLLDWIDRYCVTYISCVPLHLHQLLREIHTDTPRLPFVRILRVGSATLPVSAVQDIRRRISRNLYINYGSTETGSIATATPTMLETNPDTVGLPLDGVTLQIVDDDGRAVTDGRLGHVRVRGPEIESGYLHVAESGQSMAFRDGWFYPGDVALVNKDGLVFLKGRSDEVMNFDGILIGPAEIESVLRQHPSVKEVAAFALPSRDHQDIPAAAIVSDQPLPVAELTHFCTLRLGVRAPRVLLRFDEIPKNAIGKIVRRRVSELALQMLKKHSRSS